MGKVKNKKIQPISLYPNKLILLACLGQYLFFLLLGIQNFIRLEGVRSSEAYASLFFGQFQSIFICLIIGTSLYLLRTSKFLKHIASITLFFIMFYMTLDQVFFGLFYDHFSWSYSEGVRLADFSVYIGSFLAEIDLSFYINIALTFIFPIYVFKQLNVEELDWRIHKKVKVLISVITLLNLIIFIVLDGNKVNNHPLFSLMPNLKKQQFEIDSSVDPASRDLVSLRYGTAKKEDAIDKKLMEFSAKINSRSEKPHIIFITLESVGSLQLFPNGKINSKATPNLAKLKLSSVLFDNIYNLFPGTTRSHVPIVTGGHNITWGSVNTELVLPFKGKTLISEVKKENYRVGWYSAMNMDFENLGIFYKNLKYDKFFDPDMGGDSFKKKHQIHSWGIDEKVIVEKASTWIKDEVKRKNTIFLHLLTNTTHHPYGAPEGYNSPFSEKSNKEKYLTSLHYTDSVIGKLVSNLKSIGIAKNTIIALSGDHGQAFGERHKRNFTHKNYLYDENIRNFLWVIDLSGSSEEISSNKRGDIGDIAPSVLSLVGQTVKDMPGKSLFNSYKERLNFFHKNATPEMWGLRDGQFKFIAELRGNKEPELYDIEADPLEQNNIASKYPKRLVEYNNLAASWYILTNNKFTDMLEGFTASDKPRYALKDIRKPGPSKIDFGLKINGEDFSVKKTFHPNETMAIRTFGNAYPNGRLLKYQFLSPSGDKSSFTLKHHDDWSTVYAYRNSREPLEEGTWTTTVWDNTKLVIEGSFLVSSKTRLVMDSFKKTSGPLYMSFGTKMANDEFVRLKAIHPDEDLAVQILLKPYSEKTKLDFLWTSPTGKEKTFWFNVGKGWDKTWVYLEKKNLEPGTWTLKVSRKGTEIIKKSFIISKSAILHRKLEK